MFSELLHGSARAIIRSLECGLARARAIAHLKRDGLSAPRHKYFFTFFDFPVMNVGNCGKHDFVFGPNNYKYNIILHTLFVMIYCEADNCVILKMAKIKKNNLAS